MGSPFGRLHARYAYLIADLRSGAVLDELPLHGVSFSTVLNDAGEFRGQLAMGDPRIAIRDPRGLTAPGRTALYVERDGVLVWGGVIWTSKYSSGDRVLEIGAAGFLSYFDHRRVLPAGFDPATGDVAAAATVYSEVGQNDIARALIRTAQSHPGGDIHVGIGDGVPGEPRTLSYQGYELKSVGEALRELAALDAGPDFLFDVGTGPGGEPVRRLRLGDPELGQSGSPHVWEFGANLVEYAWPQDGSAMASRVYALGAGSETGQLIAVAEDRDRQNAGWPLLETEVAQIHVTDLAVLRSHATAELGVVSRPVVLPELVVRADLDPVLGSYQAGDYGRVHIKDSFFPSGTAFDVRILALEVTPGDDAGEELVKLTVSPIQGVQS
jgi:hypothetical protein